MQIYQCAQRIVFQPCGKLMLSDGSEDRHELREKGRGKKMNKMRDLLVLYGYFTLNPEVGRSFFSSFANWPPSALQVLRKPTSCPTTGIKLNPNNPIRQLCKPARVPTVSLQPFRCLHGAHRPGYGLLPTGKPSLAICLAITRRPDGLARLKLA